jgi:hypothetical protein
MRNNNISVSYPLTRGGKGGWNDPDMLQVGNDVVAVVLQYIHHTPYTRTPYTIHSYTTHHTTYTVQHAPYSHTVIHHTPYRCPLHHTPYTHTTCTIHHTPYTIHHTPYTIHHTPYTIHHTLYPIHSYTHTPYTIQVPPTTPGRGKTAEMFPEAEGRTQV